MRCARSMADMPVPGMGGMNKQWEIRIEAPTRMGVLKPLRITSVRRNEAGTKKLRLKPCSRTTSRLQTICPDLFTTAYGNQIDTSGVGEGVMRACRFRGFLKAYFRAKLPCYGSSYGLEWSSMTVYQRRLMLTSIGIFVLDRLPRQQNLVDGPLI